MRRPRAVLALVGALITCVVCTSTAAASPAARWVCIEVKRAGTQERFICQHRNGQANSEAQGEPRTITIEGDMTIVEAEHLAGAGESHSNAVTEGDTAGESAGATEATEGAAPGLEDVAEAGAGGIASVVLGFLSLL